MIKPSRHYLILVGILILGGCLRFWHLDLKPVWLDEVITALFSLGRNYYDVPLNEAFPLVLLDRVFTLKPETSCAQIAQTVASQSVHPPLFFCWMHDWLRWVQVLPLSWVWKLRALPALIGVVAIAALYQLNRLAFSPTAGLAGAMIMAVSPFAVYLSQEARHYTLPMLLVTLALLGLYQVQTDLYQRQIRPGVWFGWIIVNGVGFYVHYFFLLAFAAQVATLLINILTFKSLPTLHPTPYTLHPRRALIAVTLATTAVCLTYVPWLSTFLSHISRPETDWMKPFEPDWMDTIAPLYQLPMGWILMVIALPVENQPPAIAIGMVLVMVLFTGWLLWRLSTRFGLLWSAPETHLATRMLAVFVLCVMLEFLAIVYGLGKDITSVPRYNFLYFPAVCALLGACLVQPDRVTKRAVTKRGDDLETGTPSIARPFRTKLSPVWIVLLVGVLSSTLVVSNQVFLKPYQPDQVAKTVQSDGLSSRLMSMAYGDLQEVALGLSFALALKPQQRGAAESQQYFAFVPRVASAQPRSVNAPSANALSSNARPANGTPQTVPSANQLWQNLAAIKQPLSPPFGLWVVTPGLKKADYPPSLSLLQTSGTSIACGVDRDRFYRLGIPYQLYRCKL
ncbi:MAG: glycosyltransferase family 39 protein [Leptolyngbya sp. BL-A-14]